MKKQKKKSERKIKGEEKIEAYIHAHFDKSGDGTVEAEGTNANLIMLAANIVKSVVKNTGPMGAMMLHMAVANEFAHITNKKKSK